MSAHINTNTANISALPEMAQVTTQISVTPPPESHGARSPPTNSASTAVPPTTLSSSSKKTRNNSHSSGSSGPEIETWADESWPLNSRQASEIITEQILQKQRSSTLFEDDNGNVLGWNHGDSDPFKAAEDEGAMTHQNSSSQGETHDPTSSATVTNSTSAGPLTCTPTTSVGQNHSFSSVVMSMMVNTTDEASPAAQEETAPAAPALSISVKPTATVAHVRRSYTHDPYCIYTGIKLLSVCTCTTCVPPVDPPVHLGSMDSVAQYAAGGEHISCSSKTFDYHPDEIVDCFHLPSSFTAYPSAHHASSSSSCGQPTSAGVVVTASAAAMNTYFTEMNSGTLTPYPSRLPPALQQLGGFFSSSAATDTRTGTAKIAATSAAMIPLPPNGICMNNTDHTSFMPPAPPLLTSCHLLADVSSCGNDDDHSQDRCLRSSAADMEKARALMGAMLVRWHRRVESVQGCFLLEQSPSSSSIAEDNNTCNTRRHAGTTTDRCCCPTVDHFGSMEEWSTACHKWWTLHFSTRQMKLAPKKIKSKKSKKAGAQQQKAQKQHTSTKLQKKEQPASRQTATPAATVQKLKGTRLTPALADQTDLKSVQHNASSAPIATVTKKMRKLSGQNYKKNDAKVCSTKNV